jgi:hypothetical protein
MNKRLLQRTLLASLLAMFAWASLPAWAAGHGASTETRDEFFIISSVNLPKHQLVLKLPTEVTMLMTVDGKTDIVGENGQKMNIGELRSGDTVYITYVTSGEGESALKIRLGPMTVKELHQRYLSGYAVPIPAPPLTPPKAAPAPQPQKQHPTRRRHPGIQRSQTGF